MFGSDVYHNIHNKGVNNRDTALLYFHRYTDAANSTFTTVKNVFWT